MASLLDNTTTIITHTALLMAVQAARLQYGQAYILHKPTISPISVVDFLIYCLVSSIEHVFPVEVS